MQQPGTQQAGAHRQTTAARERPRRPEYRTADYGYGHEAPAA